MSGASQAWRASLKLGFTAQDSGRSVLSTREHEGPLLVQRALYPEGPRACHVAILHPPSGIAGGDALQIEVSVDSGAHATLTTPGATRWYKANGRQASQTVCLHVRSGGRLDWLPMENIFFDQADAVARNHISLESGAQAIGWEISQLGGIHHTPAWPAGRVGMDTRIIIDGKPFWTDQGVLDAQDAARDAIAGLAGFPVHAMLWAFGPALDAASCEALAAQMTWADHLRAGVTMLPFDARQSLCLLRAVGEHAEDVRRLLIGAWTRLRPQILHTEGLPLRLWDT